MLFRYELRRFRSGLPLLALLFVLLVPAIYGGVYLASNWDPYGRMDRLPVAIVNEDQPVEYEGRTLSTGADVTRSLVDGKAFDWRETTREDAESGLRDGRYFLYLEIPHDLSADLVSPAEHQDPKQARITLHRDDSNGFVIGSVTASSQSRIENAVDRSAVEAYFKAVFADLGTLREGMVQAADGGARLEDGARQAHQGSTELSTGLGSAKDGSARLADGAGRAREGSRLLASGAVDAKDGADRLAAGVADAQRGAGTLVDGTAQAQAGAARLRSGADRLAAGAPALQEGADELQGGLSRLQSGSEDLAAGAQRVAAGTQELSDTLGPRLAELGRSQAALAEAVGSVDQGVQAVDAALGSGATGVAGRVGSAQDQLAALAAQNPGLADSAGYASLQSTLVGAQERAATAQAASRTTAAGSAATSEKVQASASGGGSAADAAAQVAELNRGAQSVASGASTLSGGIAQARQGAISLGGGVGGFTAGLAELSEGAGSLDSGLARLDTGAASLRDGLGTLRSGATSLADGNGRLAEGATSLDQGLGGLEEGATSLDDGLGTLQDGAGRLEAGLGSLQDGAQTLATRLTEGAERIPALSERARQDAALVMSQPVKVDMDVAHPAHVYGRGMAPLFFSIALWVFGIAAFNIMRPVSGRMLAGRRGPLALTLSAWLPLGLVAVAASMVLLLCTLPMGLDPRFPARLVALLIVTAAVFSLIAHLLQTALGKPGTALLLVLLMLQLASTGGTYPASVLPGFFRWLNPLMPMTYSIEAFRQAISGGADERFWGPLLVLLLIGAAATAVDLLVIRRRRRFRMKDLHPALEG